MIIRILMLVMSLVLNLSLASAEKGYTPGKAAEKSAVSVDYAKKKILPSSILRKAARESLIIRGRAVLRLALREIGIFLERATLESSEVDSLIINSCVARSNSLYQNPSMELRLSEILTKSESFMQICRCYKGLSCK